MQAPGQLVRVISRPNPNIHSIVNLVVGRRFASHNVQKSTYNDLPSPSGNWQTHYEAQQRKYNAQLALGIGALIGTIVLGKAAGMFEFYNDYPERPATIENYKD